jgi:hypothetical protein
MSHDDLHVVLNQDDGEAELAMETCNGRTKIRRLVRIHARGGLVQQQQGKLRREGAGELDFALVAIRKARHQVVGAIPQAAPPATSRESRLPRARRMETAASWVRNRRHGAYAGRRRHCRSPAGRGRGGCSGRFAPCRATHSAPGRLPATSWPRKTMRPPLGLKTPVEGSLMLQTVRLVSRCNIYDKVIGADAPTPATCGFVQFLCSNDGSLTSTRSCASWAASRARAGDGRQWLHRRGPG